MVRYFFHLRSRGENIDDPEGRECKDLSAAHMEAVATARVLTAKLLLKGQHPDGQHFEICDAEGKVLLAVPFVAALL